MPTVRNCSHSGSWYSNDPEQLRSQLNNWLSSASQTALDVVDSKALIGPHAGYAYSGATAAFAYVLLDRLLSSPKCSIKRIFVLGPSHHVYLEDRCLVSSCSHCKTPFGLLGVDAGVVDRISRMPGFGSMPKEVDEDEHSIEMHLPYIHHCLMKNRRDLTVVPIMVGSLTVGRETIWPAIVALFGVR